MEYDRVQLKRSVKQSMRCTSPSPMLATLLFTIAVSVGTGLINGILGGLLTGGFGSISDTMLLYLQQGYEVEEALNIVMLELFRRGPGAIFGAIVGGGVLSILISLWQSTMNVGYEGYCLSMVREENPPFGRLFCAFPQIGGVVITRVLAGLFIFLWTLLLAVGWSVLALAAVALSMAIDSRALMVLLMLVLIAALWVGAIWVTLRYVLVDYVLLDQGKSGLDAIRESKRLMKGRIKKAFVLQLSFFGWYILQALIIYIGVILALLPLLVQRGIGASAGGLVASAAIALGIGVLSVVGFAALSMWLQPYATGAMAKFYDWAKADADGFGGGLDFGPGPDSGGRGWGQPDDYTWTTGPTSGTGTGSGGSTPLPPRPPRDDPWN